MLSGCDEPPPPDSTVIPRVTPGGPDGSAATPAPDDSRVTQADITFVGMMIEHHLQAIELSELARTRMVDPELIGLSERIRLTQAAEAEAMQSWIDASRTGEHHAHDHDIAMPGSISRATFQRAESLSGTAFDHLYIDVMITHHRGAIEMAEERLQTDGEPSVARWARGIAASQAIEIDRLNEIGVRLTNE